MRPTHLGLHHLALWVADLTKARHFYVALLGYAVEWQPDADTLYLCSGADNLALHRRPPGMAPRAVGQRLNHLGILVADAAGVAAWESHLGEAGVTIVHPTRTHRDGATSCTVLDPDGAAVQILHHPPITEALSSCMQAVRVEGRKAP